MGNSSSGNNQHDKADILYFDELVKLYKKLCAYGLFDQKLFNEHFSGPSVVLKKNLYELFFIDFLNSSDAAARLFAERCNIILDIESKPKKDQFGIYFDLLHEKGEPVTESSILELLKICCEYSLLSPDDHINVEESDAIFSGLVKDLSETNNDISNKEDFTKWALETCPFLFNGFQSWLQTKFTGVQNIKSQKEILALPSACVEKQLLLNHSLLWFLSSTLPSCYLTWESKYSGASDVDEVDAGFQAANQSWNLLYDSSEHGLSLNRFKNKVLSYKSPTLTLIQLSDSTMLVLGIDQPWKDATERYGGPYCCLKEIYPKYQVLEENSNIVYFKETSRSLPTGIMIGKSVMNDKLKIDSEFGDVKLLRDGVYKDIPIDKIEVWGCGGIDALTYQAGIKKWELKETEKRKKVKLPGQWDTDKTILEMGGVTVNHSQRGDI